MTVSTDRERLLDLLETFGVVPLTAGSERPKRKDYFMHDIPEGNKVVLAADHGKVDGYTGFFCEWDFNDDGGFKGVGVWE